MTVRRKLVLTVLLLGFLGSLTGLATYAAFSSTTVSPGNSFSAGTVVISDNDSGTAMLALANAIPGSSDTSCIRLTYTGSLDANVRLYATLSGGLASYMTLTVTRGTDSAPSFDSCTSFAADSTDYIGSGAGVVYSGLLSAFPSSYSSGIIDPTAGSPETWTNSETHSYRFVVSLNSDTAAQGQTASATFTWEAQNT